MKHIVPKNFSPRSKKTKAPKTEKELDACIAKLPRKKLMQAIQQIATAWWCTDCGKLDFGKEPTSDDYEVITAALCSIGACPAREY